jgi:hypothetical protein
LQGLHDLADERLSGHLLTRLRLGEGRSQLGEADQLCVDRRPAVLPIEPGGEAADGSPVDVDPKLDLLSSSGVDSARDRVLDRRIRAEQRR